VFSCLHCGKRLVAGPLTSALIKAEQQLGVESEPRQSEVPERTWSIEKPTKPGWYWYKADKEFSPIILLSKLSSITSFRIRPLRTKPLAASLVQSNETTLWWILPISFLLTPRFTNVAGDALREATD
jgi:hypothetical protein